jgi:hypothetical protein
MAEVPVDSGIPSEIVPIVNLCGKLSYTKKCVVLIDKVTGRLPLTIGIVAGLIRGYDHEAGWGKAVLEMLQEDRQGALADEDGGLSPSELVVRRSLDSLSNEDPKELFQLLSVTPEDASICLSVVVRKNGIIR